MYKNPLVIKYKILRLVLHCRELGYSVNYHICNYNIYNKSFLKKCLNHKKKKIIFFPFIENNNKTKMLKSLVFRVTVSPRNIVVLCFLQKSRIS